MVIKRGFLEILEMAKGKEPKSFNDFTRIEINKKGLSSATVAKRLDRLITMRVLEEVVERSKTGRRVIAYKLTDKGKRVAELAEELEEAFTDPKNG